MKWNPLNPEEKRVIEEKGTETPYSGEYLNLDEKGFYRCRRCGAYLYRSGDKFDSHCGWPSFDDEIPGAVKRTVDADGRRTEISCVRCGAHLGHVFSGEGLTEKNVRHCVNSVSLKFVPEKESGAKKETAYFSGGCFWCVETVFLMLKGVETVVSGYAVGSREKNGGRPSYEDVSSGKTAYAETVKVDFDPRVISYEALLEVFFVSHDPTTPDRQGADIGRQYRSAIFCADPGQMEIAAGFVKNLEADNVFSRPIMTEVEKLGSFYEAEKYHRDYFRRNPSNAYCQSVISPKVSDIRRKMGKYLK